MTIPELEFCEKYESYLIIDSIYNIVKHNLTDEGKKEREIVKTFLDKNLNKYLELVQK